jgi:glycosyltransferase involved in cell wall biosynthesis
LYIKDAIAIGKLIRENVEDAVVTTQDPFETGLAGYLIAQHHKARLNAQVHTDLFSPYFRMSVLNTVRLVIAKYILPRADSIRVVSERIKESLGSLKLKAKPVVLPIWTDIATLSHKVPTVNLREHYPQFEKIILMVARFEKEKNISLALQSLEEVKKTHPKIGLVLVGDGQLKKDITKEIASRGLIENVVLVGWQHDVSGYYRTADMYLCTSQYEGFGLSLVEAGASHCPIVSTDIGLVGSVLHHGESVEVVKPQYGSVAEGITKVIENEQYRISLRDKAYKAVQSIYSTKEHYLQAYKKAL